jgi:hypothetical protein
VTGSAILGGFFAVSFVAGAALVGIVVSQGLRGSEWDTWW